MAVTRQDGLWLHSEEPRPRILGKCKVATGENHFLTTVNSLYHSKTDWLYTVTLGQLINCKVWLYVWVPKTAVIDFWIFAFISTSFEYSHTMPYIYQRHISEIVWILLLSNLISLNDVLSLIKLSVDAYLCAYVCGCTGILSIVYTWYMIVHVFMMVLDICKPIFYIYIHC